MGDVERLTNGERAFFVIVAATGMFFVGGSEEPDRQRQWRLPCEATTVEVEYLAPREGVLLPCQGPSSASGVQSGVTITVPAR